MLLNQETIKEMQQIPPSLIVGFQNLVFLGHFSPEFDDMEIEINEGDIFEDPNVQPCPCASILVQQRLQQLYDMISTAVSQLGNIRSSITST